MQHSRSHLVDTRQEQFARRLVSFITPAFWLAGGVFLLICLHSMYDAVSGQQESGTLVDVALRYLLPAALAILCLAPLCFRPIHRLNCFVSLLACAAAIYAAELVLAYAGDEPVVPVMAELAAASRSERTAELGQAGLNLDTRAADSVIEEMRQKGVNATPILTVSNHLFLHQPDGHVTSAINIDGREVLPLGGVSNRVTLLCNENGEWVSYRSDSRGFNNPDDVWRPRRLDIAALGDSFVHGYCVPPNDNFVAAIRRRVPATINLGMAGDGPLLMLATLKEYLPSRKPGTVLWFYYEGNDLTDLQLERQSTLLMRYLKGGFHQPDLARQAAIDRQMINELPRIAAEQRREAKERQRNSVSYNVLAFAKLTHVRERLGLLGSSADEIESGKDLEQANMDVFRQVMTQAKAEVDSWAGRLYFVYLPEWARYAGRSTWGQRKRNDVKSIVSRLGVPVIDITDVFEAQADPLSLFPFRGVGHYTATGHRLVAEEVLDRIFSRDEASPQAP